MKSLYASQIIMSCIFTATTGNITICGNVMNINERCILIKHLFRDGFNHCKNKDFITLSRDTIERIES